MKRLRKNAIALLLGIATAVGLATPPPAALAPDKNIPTTVEQTTVVEGVRWTGDGWNLSQDYAESVPIETVALRELTPVERESFRFFGDIGKGLYLPSDSGSDRCGISYLWALPADHPFNPCCQAHDTEYDMPNPRPRLAVDLAFYSCCVDVAKSITFYRAQALIFYRIVRTFGSLWYEGPK